VCGFSIITYIYLFTTVSMFCHFLGCPRGNARHHYLLYRLLLLAPVSIDRGGLLFIYRFFIIAPVHRCFRKISAVRISELYLVRLRTERGTRTFLLTSSSDRSCEYCKGRNQPFFESNSIKTSGGHVRQHTFAIILHPTDTQKAPMRAVWQYRNVQLQESGLGASIHVFSTDGSLHWSILYIKCLPSLGPTCFSTCCCYCFSSLLPSFDTSPSPSSSSDSSASSSPT
jgi:hypothetical protein